MKKIKLLTPILGLTTVTSGMLPLVCCHNKDNDDPQYTQVTEADWKAAIDYICGKTDQEVYWHFDNQEDYLTKAQITEEQTAALTYNKLYVAPTGYYVVGSNTSAESTLSGSTYGYKAGNWTYCKNAYEGLETEYRFDSESFEIFLWDIYGLLYDTYSYFSTDDNNCYCYTGKQEGVISINTRVGFNADKKISYINSTIYEKLDDVVIVLALNNHFDYSKNQIEYPQDMLDRMSRHVYSMKDAKTVPINTGSCKTETEGVVVNIVPPEGEFDSLGAYKGEASGVSMFSNVDSNVTIYKNGTLLQKGTDKDYYINNNWRICFKTKLTNNDNVSIWFQPLQNADNTYRLDLLQEA